MRHLKSILLIMALCLVFSLCSTGMAEDEIVSAPVDIEVGEAESIGINGLYSEDDTPSSDTAMLDDTTERYQAISASNNGDFEINEDGILTNYYGLDQHVIIPDSVVSIDYGTFQNMTDIKSVTIPDSVVTIASYTFSGCINLSNVRLSNKVTVLNEALFSGCDGLTDVTIPDSVTEIRAYALADCSNLRSVTIPASVNRIDRTAFNDCSNFIIRGVSGSYAEQYAKTIGVPFNAPILSFDGIRYNEDEEEYEDIILINNQTITLKAIQTPSDMASSIKWESSNEKVVSVDQNGNITGVSMGTATITASTTDGKGKAVQVKVYVPESVDISLESDDDYGDIDSVPLGYTKWISAYTEVPDDYPSGTKYPISWSTSDESILSIAKTEDGKNGAYRVLVKGEKLGRANLIATTEDNGKASVEVNVYKPEPTTIGFWNSDDEVLLGNAVWISAYTEVSEDYPSGTVFPVSWSTSDKSILSIEKTKVTKDGYYMVCIKGNKVGKAKLIAKTRDGGKASLIVTVYRPQPDTIKIDQFGPVLLKPGQKTKLSATVTPKTAESKVSWKSLDTGIVQVSEKGVITAVDNGYTRIIAKAKNGIEDYYSVYVCKNPIKLKKATISIGKQDKFSLNALMPSTYAENVYAYESSNTDVITINGNGIVKAWKTGKAVAVIYSYDKVYNAQYTLIPITVKPGPKTITLYKSGKKVKAGATLELKKGKSLTLKAKLPSGTLSTLTWSSNKPSVAKVSKTGKVMALKAGAATITVRAANGTKVKVKIRVK